MSDLASAGRSAFHRAASEALHRSPVADRQAARYRKLWECGFADLIRADFYALLDLPRDACGNLLEAGCGTGIDTANLCRLAPRLSLVGVDISSVALADATARSDTGDARFHQAGLERLPFADAVFDYVASHEVIEHVEDPAAVLAEFLRVLRPGGVAVIATPNGASWWLEHQRQRVKRLLGRRGASVGEDHVRSPSFWRREFRRAGFVVERQIFDGAALEFQMLVAPARWMPTLSRLFEPLRIVPGINLVLCDRVKFRLSKPGHTAKPRALSRFPPKWEQLLPSVIPDPEIRVDGRNKSGHDLRRSAAVSGNIAAATTCCPICRAALSESAAAVACSGGHRFIRNRIGVIDFTTPAPERSSDAGAVTAAPAAGAPPDHPSTRHRRWRRLALVMLSGGYAGYLLLLAPFGVVLGLFHQPFRRQRDSAS